MYKYKAYDPDGSIQEGEIEAQSIASAKKSLIGQGLMIAAIKQEGKSISVSNLFSTKKVGINDLEFLTSELAILLNSGVKIDKGLKIIGRGSKSPAVNKVVNEINDNLKSGCAVAEAFSTKEPVFDSLYINLIDIGERTGKLAEVFQGLANDMKFKAALKAKITQAVTYPAIILFVCIACILFVFNYIVPQMGSIFSEGDQIPVYTQFLLGASEWMIKYQVWLFIGIFSSAFLLYQKRHAPEVKSAFARYSLSLPLLANLVIQIERIRFNSSMALMLDAGIKLDVAMAAAAKNIKHPLIRTDLERANDRIKTGEPVAQSLSKTKIYPVFYVSLLEVGEESGKLATIFSEIAERSKKDFEVWTDKVTNILEPLLILVMGGIVGSVVITMLLSVVSVNEIAI